MAEIIDISTRRKLEDKQTADNLRAELLPYYRGQWDLITSLERSFQELLAIGQLTAPVVLFAVKTTMDQVRENHMQVLRRG